MQSLAIELTPALFQNAFGFKKTGHQLKFSRFNCKDVHEFNITVNLLTYNETKKVYINTGTRCEIPVRIETPMQLRQLMSFWVNVEDLKF